MSLSGFLRNLLYFITTWVGVLLLVFFMGQKAPGRIVEDICNACSSLGSRTHAQEKDKECLEKSLNLHLPLFYIGITSLAHPDTFYRISSPQKTQALGWLLHQSGDWEAVHHYFRSLEAFNLSHPHLGLEKTLYSPWMGYSTIPYPYQGSSPEKQTIDLLKQRYEQLLNSPSWWKVYIPRIQYYGRKNQFHSWVYDLLVKQELGISYQQLDCRHCSCHTQLNLQNRSISFQKPFTRTFLLAIISSSLALVIASLCALLFVIYERSIWVTTGNTLLLFWEAIPLFGIGLTAFILLRLHQYQEKVTIWEELMLLENLRIWGLCIGILTSISLPILIRIIQSGLLEESKKGYYTTALSKGLSIPQTLVYHIFPNIAGRLFTLYILTFSSFLNGSVILESIFDIPGMGKLILSAALSYDIQPLLIAIMVVAFLTLSGYYLADYISAKWDPRIP